ncbi:MAG: CsbD family protein [Brevundimonas sp.]
MVDNDRIEGSAKQAEGKLKEGAGQMTGDQKLEAEGKARQAEGKVQSAVGGAKDSVKD